MMMSKKIRLDNEDAEPMESNMDSEMNAPSYTASTVSSKSSDVSKKQRRWAKIQSKQYPELVIQILPMWEEFRKAKTESSRRSELITSILKLCKDKLTQLAMAQDTARIIESIIHLGDDRHREQVFVELRLSVRLLAKSIYARHIIAKLIKYGSPVIRLALFKSFLGHSQRLAQHKYACQSIDAFFNDCANSSQRATLVNELYGGSRLDGVKPSQNLATFLEARPEEQRHSLLNELSVFLLNAITKGLESHTIIQHVLLEYLRVAGPKTNQDHVSSVLEQLFTDESLNHLVNLLTTRQGVRAGLLALALSPTALRKAAVKQLKTCVESLARSPHGHWFLLGLIDMVDDFLLLEKVVLKELLEDLNLTIIHPESRKVLLYALSPRDRRHFSPQLISQFISPCDALNRHTRKPLGLRAFELRRVLLPSLLELVASEKLAELFGADSSSSSGDLGRIVLLTEILSTSSKRSQELSTLLVNYKRSPSTDNPNADDKPQQQEGSTGPVQRIDLDKLARLRHAALVNFVDVFISPDFKPVGDISKPANSDATSSVTRDQLRAKRHRLAVTQAEKLMQQMGKPTFESFEMGNEDQDEANDDDDDDEASSPTVEEDEAASLPLSKAHFMERPEGHLCIRRLLTEEAEAGDLILARLIMERVSTETLRSWTQCNRTCFVLVKLFEFKDESISAELKCCLEPCKAKLQLSAMPGAKILTKFL